MVPTRPSGAGSLADVLPSCAAAILGPGAGFDDTLGLGAARSVVLLLVDGLGSAALSARSAYARTLAAKRTSLFSGFPTTTASALATVTTGALPGEHGLVGYSVLDPEGDRVVKQLSEWTGAVDPATWQRRPTVFESVRASGADVALSVVGPARYAASGLTKAILRGADYRSADSVSARFDETRRLLAAPGRSLTYLYVPELDMAGHRYGWESDRWSAALESLDAEIRRLEQDLAADQALVVTADHGVLDVPNHRHIVYGDEADLMNGVRHVAGEPRCLQLHVDPTASAEQRADLLAAWRESEDSRSWVVSRDEAVEAGWFGEVAPDVLPRIGDVLVAARKGIAYYRGENDRGRGMIGQHGSWSSEETQVPLIRFGAFA
ncbi:putative AlkP superfamily pyrophosphatase or phosphodiesterase [Frondihabitans australicus]|uniref:Putative AlkP superfamily pyrophosphatase or phosphodiesterase n=2 Tax=Frondihabitans australicus TaxID=386892 RepID=A0A495IFA6_9MICO|nr:putative AlkP superfamily pyrophosphatase or phosphodiesterase [Frondihabitans australicus]